MNLKSIQRLAGYEDNNDSFAQALQSVQSPETKQNGTVLAEDRGRMRFDESPVRQRVYSRLRIAESSLEEVCEVLHQLWSSLDAIRYGSDPATKFGEVAEKIQTGPLSVIDRMVKTVGFALSESFTRFPRRFGGDDGALKCAVYGRSELDALGLHLRGEVAESLAILKVVAESLKDMKATQAVGVDLDMWAKGWTDYSENMESRTDAIAEMLTSLADLMDTPQ